MDTRVDNTAYLLHILREVARMNDKALAAMCTEKAGLTPADRVPFNRGFVRGYQRGVCNIARKVLLQFVTVAVTEQVVADVPLGQAPSDPTDAEALAIITILNQKLTAIFTALLLAQ